MPELIDRQAVLAEIGEFQIRFNETGDSHERVAYASAEHCMLVIKAAPAVNRWIPCSERLPENFVWCLVCMSDGCIRLGKWNGEYDEQGVWWVSHPNSGGKLYRIKNVPFWMLLPEPPEKE